MASHSSSKNGGLYGSNFDRQVERYDGSAVSKMQQRYWQAKQTFIRKLKRKEDDCVVASDHELDAKLEVSFGRIARAIRAEHC